MPLLRVQSNSKPEDESAFITTLSTLVTELVMKPEKYVMVQYQHIPSMCMGGSSDNCAVLNFHCIGKIGVEENKQFSESIGKYITKKLNVDGERMYIFFEDCERANVGWNYTTFA